MACLLSTKTQVWWQTISQLRLSCTVVHEPGWLRWREHREELKRKGQVGDLDSGMLQRYSMRVSKQTHASQTAHSGISALHSPAVHPGTSPDSRSPVSSFLNCGWRAAITTWLPCEALRTAPGHGKGYVPAALALPGQLLQLLPACFLRSSCLTSRTVEEMKRSKTSWVLRTWLGLGGHPRAAFRFWLPSYEAFPSPRYAPASSVYPFRVVVKSNWCSWRPGERLKDRSSENVNYCYILSLAGQM